MRESGLRSMAPNFSKSGSGMAGIAGAAADDGGVVPGAGGAGDVTAFACGYGLPSTPLNADFRANNADYRRRADERFGGPGVWMQADELTGAGVFLASEDADSVTGATLYVDRGWSAY